MYRREGNCSVTRAIHISIFFFYISQEFNSCSNHSLNKSFLFFFFFVKEDRNRRNPCVSNVLIDQHASYFFFLVLNSRSVVPVSSSCRKCVSKVLRQVLEEY